MPNPYKVGNKAYDDQAAILETTRMVAVNAAGASQSAITAAEITYYRGQVANALAHNISAASFTTALKALGVQS
jgi:hypothetical protein